MKKLLLWILLICLPSIAQIHLPIFFQNTAISPAFVQLNSFGSSYGPPNNSTTNETTAVTLNANVVVGNTLIVFVNLHTTSAGGSTGAPYTVTDSLGNTYTQDFIFDAGNQSGGSAGEFHAQITTGGSDTITFHWVAHVGFSSGYNAAISALEYSGMSGMTVQGSNHGSRYTGGTPALAVTDSHGATITTTFPTITDTAYGVVDFLVRGTDYFFAEIDAGVGTTTVTSPYSYLGVNGVTTGLPNSIYLPGNGFSFPNVRNTSQQITAASSLAVAWPSGTVVNDTVVIFISGQNSLSSPGNGWAVLQNAATAANWNNGGAFYKVMTSADITAGSQTFSASAGVLTAAVVTLVGPVFIEETVTSWANASTATVTTSTSARPTNNNLAIIFGSARTSATPTSNIGTLVQGQNNTSNGSSALYTFRPSSTGVLSPQFTYSGYNPAGYWQAVVVVE